MQSVFPPLTLSTTVTTIIYSKAGRTFGCLSSDTLFQTATIQSFPATCGHPCTRGRSLPRVSYTFRTGTNIPGRWYLVPGTYSTGVTEDDTWYEIPGTWYF